jgi:hypothetical protein
MRDIRPDLRLRHAAVMGRIADEQADYQRTIEALEANHQEQMAVLERERKAVEALLVIEEQRDGLPQLERAPSRPPLPLGEFIATMVYAHGPMDKEELRAEAHVAGYFNDTINGRSFHTTLMNIVKHGKIMQTPDGKYAYPATAMSAPLFHGGHRTQ